jgi:hypothetical protein
MSRDAAILDTLYLLSDDVRDERWQAFCDTVEARIEAIRATDEGFDGAVQGWEMIPPRPRVHLNPLLLTQRCSACRIVKPLREFGISRRYSSGRYYQCTICKRAANRAYAARAKAAS